MTAHDVIFWILALGAGAGAIAVVLTQNVVRMAFWLVVSLGSTAGLFFLLHADFVAATQLLIYVGGTVVLLIFGVMLTARGPYVRIRSSTAELFVSGGLGLLVFFMFYAAITGVDWNRSTLAVADLAAIPRDRFEERLDDATAAERELLLGHAEHEPAADAAEPHGDEGRESTAGHHDEAAGPFYVLDEDANVYRLAPAQRLTTVQRDYLAGFWKADDRMNRPPGIDKREGGTARPIGFSFLGARPDRDLGRASADAKLSTGYLLPFEIVSVHLLVVLIGAAYLARAKRRKPADET
ncbi:MAG: NADH-quinone oxidoreductase subunit J [Planctomycetes bacterium]|nr:NADH-quinone oxidoreductase subunit J [Planctomycetota bacterium]